MPKRARQDPDNAVSVRVEVVPRRGLSRQEAARYVGISTSTFDKLVQEGKMPQPFRIGSRTIWDLRKLDAASLFSAVLKRKLIIWGLELTTHGVGWGHCNVRSRHTVTGRNTTA